MTCALVLLNEALDLDLCDGPCRKAYALFVRTRDGRQLCPACWENVGRPNVVAKAPRAVVA